MDELAKTEARNYLSAAGFFLMLAYFLQMIFSIAGNDVFVESDDTLKLALGIGLLVVATLLIVLRKRDMIALLLFMMGFDQLFCAFTSSVPWSVILIGFMVLIALVTLTSKEKMKWLLFLIPAFLFVGRLLWECCGYNATIELIFNIILAVLCLYYAFACASERLSLPGRKILTADETTDFKASGSALGYMLFATLAGGYTFHYILGEAALPLATFQTMQLICGALLAFVAILLLAIGKMRFTPIMFLLIGLVEILVIYSSGAMFIGVGILFIILGLFAMLRKESRILPGLMLIIYGCTDFFTAYATGGVATAPVVSIILNGIPALIAIYLAFVVYSQRKLPKF